jgi:hypothetical protein
MALFKRVVYYKNNCKDDIQQFRKILLYQQGKSLLLHYCEEYGHGYQYSRIIGYLINNTFFVTSISPFCNLTR